jgi:NDP-sugar pyrophosphorylase family protein
MSSAGIIAAGWGERLGQKQPKALTRIGRRTLIDYTLDGLIATGVQQVTCIVNEAAKEVPAYVAQARRPLEMDWVIQTTPSSMHSFLIVLGRLAERSPESGFLMTTVDSICPPRAYTDFAKAVRLFPQADLVLGLTEFIDDEKPLRVAMRGEERTGLLPQRVEEDPAAFEIVALTNNGFDSTFVTAGFYWAGRSILKEKEVALGSDWKALRQFLGHLLRNGYRIYGVPLPPVVDVDRPEDVRSAEELLKTL